MNLSLSFKFSHLRVVVKTVHVHKVVVKTDVSDSFVVEKRLEADSAEVGKVHSPLHIDLGVTPAKFKLLK